MHYMRHRKHGDTATVKLPGRIKIRTCSVDGCGGGAPIKRGMCATHYQRWRKYGDVNFTQMPRGWRSAPCDVPGCDNPRQTSSGYCEGHYRRWLHRGDPRVDIPLRVRGSTDIGYPAAHYRVRRDRGKAALHSCVDCGGTASDWSYDGTDPDERTDRGRAFSLDPNRYQPRCRSCHSVRDETIENLHGRSTD
jgi:hypothetical protein